METFLAILVLMTLALVATSPRFYRLRRLPAMSVLMSGGWLAIAAGVLLSPEGVDLISREALRNATPLLMMALGWIGFVIGLQARREVLVNVIRETARLLVIDVVVSVAVFGGVSLFIILRWTGHHEAAWLMGPAGLLSAAALGWSMETRSLVRDRSPRAQHLALLLRAGGTLSSLAAILWFGILYELPHRVEGGLVLDWTGAGFRLGLAILLAILMGALGQLAFRRAGRAREQQLVVSLGIVVFVAGLATELGASPLLASMLTGVVIANLSGKEFQRFERFIIQAEHVVAVLLALIAGLLMKLDIQQWGVILV
ncbi:MAG: cation:proton antiporter, partial [Phycisphaerales bacterium]|nr:cation:proton antiporter [Phycisphaerales bacterium]